MLSISSTIPKESIEMSSNLNIRSDGSVEIVSLPYSLAMAFRALEPITEFSTAVSMHNNRVLFVMFVM